jgi:hypothetical protein
MKMKKSNPKSMADRLKSLWDDIHTHRKGTSWRDPGSYTETRALTKKEWALVLSAIKEGYPASIYTHGFGFAFALGVFEPVVPTYPGVPVEPNLIFLMAANQYPGNSPKKNGADQKLRTNAERPGGVFEVFEALCNTPENLAALDREGIERPKSRGHYQY